MELITIGPIPREIIEPKEVPKRIARYSNREREDSAIPNKGILDKTKKATRITSVHLRLTLKLTFFSFGARTSGRLCSKSLNPVEYY